MDGCCKQQYSGIEQCPQEICSTSPRGTPPGHASALLSAFAPHAVKAAPAGGLTPGLDLFVRSGVWEARRWLRGELSPLMPCGLALKSLKSESPS